MKSLTADAADADASRANMNIRLAGDLRADLCLLISEAADAGALAFSNLAWHAARGDVAAAATMFAPARSAGIAIRDALAEIERLAFHSLGRTPLSATSDVEGRA